MPSQGYVQFPTIHQDHIIFVSEDDLWLVGSEGGRAERLTAGVSRVGSPHFSPDGQFVAFVGREEGPGEVYVMPASGGAARRLTFQADPSCCVLGWSPDGDRILYTSSAGQFSHSFTVIYAISPTSGHPQQLPVGMANAISYGPDGGIVLGRNIDEPAYWKRYRGGTVGHLWCDSNGTGSFQRLLHLHGNVADPCWVGNRIYFLSDHEGVGNIYSCTPQGEDLRRHSDQRAFYARNLSTDGTRLVFHAGADLYLFDPREDTVHLLPVTLPSQRIQLNRKFVTADYYLDTLSLHPQGHALALTTRGKAFSMSNWEGAVIQHGERDGVRYRFLEWLNDGKRLVAICDAPGREVLVVFSPEEGTEPKMLSEIEFGRAVEITVSPIEDLVAIANHRNELIVVHIESGHSATLDRSDYGRIQDVTWSPDATWIAYSFPLSAQKKAIKLGDMESGETHVITEPVLEDVCPSFDPEGKYLYFLGYRSFNPVHDNLQFAYSFPRGVVPYLITLQRDLRSPFIPEPKLLSEKSEENARKPEETPAEQHEEQEENAPKDEAAEKEEESKKARTITIDLDGITDRALPFPVGEGRYASIWGIKGKALFLIQPILGTLGGDGGGKSAIEGYDFETQRNERLIENVSSFQISRDARTLLYRSRFRLRVIRAGEKPPRTENNDHPGRESGWLDMSRVKVSVQPALEWKQMFAEAWRLQREQFWTEDMSGVDWDGIYKQYIPLLERVSSRSELSDLLKELLGELGTSHTYERGGDYRAGRYYRQGFLGVDWSYDAETQRYAIARIVRGDPSDKTATSPLTLPGLKVAEGDVVLSINGQRVGPQASPQELLVFQAGQDVQLTLEAAKTSEKYVVTAHALYEEFTARYRDWVERNRAIVHERSDGCVGYIHVPNMKEKGFAEFHRSYLAEYDHPALIVDVRWNTGGYISGLLLEKLARKRVGYKFQRWGQPMPYPPESPRGPMVALANEHTSSDGDIFSHSFKLLGLGPLIGMRTWGGVIGYRARHSLVDGTETTQPEFANWFKDVGWDMENRGTDPDIEVDIAPQDFDRSIDPQLERAITEALHLIETYPSLEPKPGEKPRKARP